MWDHELKWCYCPKKVQLGSLIYPSKESSFFFEWTVRLYGSQKYKIATRFNVECQMIKMEDGMFIEVPFMGKKGKTPQNSFKFNTCN